MLAPLYALGAFGAGLLIQTLTLWLFPFYAASGPVRLPAEQVGLALALGRLANSAGDVLVAVWSDRISTPWGRRYPFLLVGSPLLATCFVLVWLPPQGGTGLYLTAVLGGFFAVFAAVVNPYLAVLADLQLSSAARVAAAGWQAVGNLLGTAAAYLASGPLHARLGFPAMATQFAAVAVVCLWAAGASAPRQPAQPTSLSLVAAARTLAGSKPLRAYLAGLSLAWVGLSMVSLVLVFLVTVLMRRPATSVPWVLGGALLSTAVCLPLLKT